MNVIFTLSSPGIGLGSDIEIFVKNWRYRITNDKYHFRLIFFEYAINVNRRPRVLWIYCQNLLRRLQNLCIQKIISEKINGLYIKEGEFEFILIIIVRYKKISWRVRRRKKVTSRSIEINSYLTRRDYKIYATKK